MKRRQLIGTAVGLLAVLGAGYWLWGGASSNEPVVEQAPVDARLEAASLAIKGISLMQGEKGFEFWRLKAEWAAMHEENGVIDVRDPKVRYTMGDAANQEYVYVVSESGQITDQQRVLTMWNNVRMTRHEDVITGPKLIYKAADRTVRFPDGAELENSTMTGKFGVLHWNMAGHRIDGEESVDVVFKAREPQPEKAAAPVTQGIVDKKPEKSAGVTPPHVTGTRPEKKNVTTRDSADKKSPQKTAPAKRGAADKHKEK